jgi:lipopolysaccharide export system protein LptA
LVVTGACCLLSLAGTAGVQASPSAPTPKADAAAANASSPAPAIFPGATSKQPINIEADKLEYLNKEGRAIYTGDVIAVQGDTTLKCSKLVIFMEKSQNSNDPKKGGQAKSDAAPQPAGGAQTPGSSGVRHMDIFGPVTLYSKDQVATGDHGVYDKPTNTAVLTGHVVMTQGTNITKGDRLTYDLTTGTATVDRDSNAPTARVQGYFIPGSSSNTNDTSKGADKNPPPKPEKPRKATVKKGAVKKKPDVNG